MLENKDQRRTDISTLGEFGLIDKLTNGFVLKQKSSKTGIGDDAAVLHFTESTLVSTDLLVEGVHFDLAYTPLKHLGYKAIAVNLSDICAMNATPTQVTVSLAVSNRFSLEALEELYEGIGLACSSYEVDLVGGDTTSSQTGLLISVTAIGEAHKKKIALRSGAKENDLLIVTGDLGGAYMGLQVLRRENEIFKVNPNHKPDLVPYSYIVERQLKPEARKDIVAILDTLKIVPTSMIDISDGLSSEILHLCKSSALGISLYEEKIPLDPTVIATCEEFQLDSTLVALSGGEDYELLFTIDQKDYKKIKGNPHFTVVGHTTAKVEGAQLITRSDSKIPLTAQGWNSFPE